MSSELLNKVKKSAILRNQRTNLFNNLLQVACILPTGRGQSFLTPSAAFDQTGYLFFDDFRSVQVVSSANCFIQQKGYLGLAIYIGGQHNHVIGKIVFE